MPFFFPQLIESGDLHPSETSVSELVDLLDSISDSIASDPENDALINNALEVLSDIDQYVSSPSLDQVWLIVILCFCQRLAVLLISAFKLLLNFLNCLALQVVIDALSFQLPKAVAKFAGASDKCLEIVDSIIDRFVASCNPRDMLSFLCEVRFATLWVGVIICSSLLLLK